MRNLDALFKLIVPGILLLFWALMQVLNKETKPVPRIPTPPGGPPRQPLPPLWNPQTGSPPRPQEGNPNEVLILESRTDRPQPPQRSTPSVKPRKGQRKATPAVPAPQQDPTRLQRVIELSSLTAAPALSSAPEALRPILTDSVALAAIREALGSRDRVRQSLILAEILKPPLALRGRGPGRRHG